MNYLDDAWDHAFAIGAHLVIERIKEDGRNQWSVMLDDRFSGTPTGLGETPEHAAEALMDGVNEQLHGSMTRAWDGPV